MMIKLKVLEYLALNRLMTLGTSKNNKPWSAAVFFAYNKKFNIIFYSKPDTKHCKNIKDNPYVSVVVSQRWKDEKSNIKGLQMTGKAFPVPLKSYARYYRLYESRFSWTDEFSSDHKLYLIKPLQIWYIDQSLFGHFHRVRIK